MSKREIKNIAVIGAGMMGRGIALSFARAGLHVSLVARDKGRLEQSLNQIENDLRLFSQYGLLKEEPYLVKSRIEPTTMIADTRDCDFVAESVPEVLQLKKQLFSELEGVCREDAILSTNTSSLKISAIVEELHTPGRIIAAHWFNPAHIMPLVELLAGQHTTKEVTSSTYELMTMIGKKPIIVKKEIAGFIVNRMQVAMRREVDYLIEDGIASPEDIDIAVKTSFGMRFSCLGPGEVADMVGLDTSMRVAEQLYKELSNNTGPSRILVDKVKKGELGIKTGRGWYDYSGKSTAQIFEERDRKLLKRLALFESESNQDTH